jgi:hypothetical protein
MDEGRSALPKIALSKLLLVQIDIYLRFGKNFLQNIVKLVFSMLNH